ncbi:MAG TPA: mannose-1-phosphate guanylyltransferase/mannose-6-phosphate isomerase [Nitrospirota bacterium]|nr:mannose-1-phosphate guanylyltransferase/mannose-6-phosphate isomerase [Nitrospirota bacterium]
MKALIMAGGQGTRFWPLSRELYPKQLLKLGEERTLLQQTVLRLSGLVKPKDISVISSDKLLVDIKSQLAELDGGQFNVILEPEPKNTAPAIGLGALYLERAQPGSVMAVLPSDHVIKEREKFHQALRKAEKLAREGYLVIFGIKPAKPETGYGYIKLGKALGGGAHMVERFVEKPDANTAKVFIKSGLYLWNSGIFVWRTDVILDEMKLLMPGLYKGLKKVWGAMGTPKEAATLAAEFKKLEPVSIDYGVMEKSRKTAVVMADFAWSDLGSWGAIEEIIKPDKKGNISVGKVVSLECMDTTFYAEDRLVAGIGLEGMIVVDTPDATLVCKKEMAQRVKDVVGTLREKGFEEYISHRTVQRPWGSYTVLLKGPGFKIKRIEVKSGARLSHQLHHHRSEHWVVVAGTARVTNGEKVETVHVNESTYIPMSTRHRLENPGKVLLQIIEVQNREYLEEDDIIRFDDDFERA